jgi:hypothetical protein
MEKNETVGKNVSGFETKGEEVRVIMYVRVKCLGGEMKERKEEVR